MLTDALIAALKLDIDYLNTELETLRDDIKPLFLMFSHYKSTLETHKYTLPTQPVVGFANETLAETKDGRKIGAPIADSFKITKSALKHKTNPTDSEMIASTLSHKSLAVDPDLKSIRVYGNMLPDRSKESYKTFRFKSTDNCFLVIPEVLGKYKIKQSGSLQEYCLFLCSGGKGALLNNQELCLSFDQKPVDVAHRLIPDVVPEFIIKHVNFKDPFSPAKPPTELLALASVVVEYNSTKDDEIRVCVGESGSIIEKKAGWIKLDLQTRQGWVPSSCIIENQDQLQSCTALADYDKPMSFEISLKKDEVVTVRRAFKTWLYIEKPYDKGWVPSCYISLKDLILEDIFKAIPQPLFIHQRKSSALLSKDMDVINYINQEIFGGFRFRNVASRY